MSFKIPITFVLIFYLLLLSTSSCTVNEESVTETSISTFMLEDHPAEENYYIGADSLPDAGFH
jgi:hypothetical protein